MTAGPIVARELRVAARNKLTYRGRMTTALIASFFVSWGMFAFNRLGFRAFGVGLFPLVTQFVYIWCLIAGLSSTVECLSSEKREGTLGFLFLTDLTGWDIVHDTAHGATVHTSGRVLRDHGARVIALGADPDGLNINDGVGSVGLRLIGFGFVGLLGL